MNIRVKFKDLKLKNGKVVVREIVTAVFENVIAKYKNIARLIV